MKKIINFKALFLIIAFVGSFVTSNANSESQETKIFYYKNGNQAVINDGSDCVKYYGEQDNGDFKLIYKTDGC